jgi:hypothetical protein
MDPLLLALTIVALIAAAAFGVVSWRLLRSERERSAARVAALSAEIDATAPAISTAGVNALFATDPSAASAGNPMIKAAVAGAMIVVFVLAAVWASSGPAATTADGSVQTASASHARGTAPLELISMRHTRTGPDLTVSGLVRNPPAGTKVTRITAVVLAFNSAGAFVTSGRAALDFTTLDPGDESPFVVTIAGAPDVARYRVSFRTDEGVVRHVDRRAEQSRLAAAIHLQ